MTFRVVPIGVEHIQRFRETTDAVFRESRMFVFLEGPPIEQVTDFVQGMLSRGEPQFVALDQDNLVGCCDIVVKPRPTLRHSGVLGIGVLSSHRGRGIGRALMGTALQAAVAYGLARVELFVRTDNSHALRLYEKLGFTVEGVLRQHLLIDGVFRDSYLMSILYEKAQPAGRGEPPPATVFARPS